MSLQLQMELMPGYLASRFTGTGVVGEGSQEFKSIAEHCKRTKNSKLLIDTMGYDVKITFTDRFLLRERLEIFALHGIKVAFVCKPEQLDPGRFAMVVAQNRGVNVEAFTDLQAAEKWLLK